jgi:uncharacterized protein (DUF58 family)
VPRTWLGRPARPRDPLRRPEAGRVRRPDRVRPADGSSSSASRSSSACPPPFALVLALGLFFADDPGLEATVSIDQDRVLEGDEVVLEVELWALRGVTRLDVLVRLPEWLVVEEGDNPVRCGCRPARRGRLTFRLARRAPGALTCSATCCSVARTRSACSATTSRSRATSSSGSSPREEQLRSLLRPRETQPYVGEEVSRRRGDGIEFADIRPFAFGDMVTRINWRATARRGELWVNDRHPERNTDIVLFLDSFTEARRGEASTLDLALRAAATLARGYIGKRDRVG